MPSVRRFDVYLVPLDPTVGREIQKTRPCLVVSPDEANGHLATVIVAPMTSQGRPHPTRIPCRFAGKSGLLCWINCEQWTRPDWSSAWGE